MATNWSNPTGWEEVCRRAAGRHHNSVRRLRAVWRQSEVVRLLAAWGLEHGVQAMIARRLGVSQATISRDVKALRSAYRVCPCCRHLVPDP